MSFMYFDKRNNVAIAHNEVSWLVYHDTGGEDFTVETTSVRY